MKIFPVTIFLAIILIVPNYALAERNPAAAYCIALGYEYKIEKTDHSETGFCILPNGQPVNDWEFLQGRVAPEFGYCAIKGYQHKTINDWTTCMKFMIETCSVCILEDGSEIEVTELMGLSFNETICGDGKCAFPENFKSCPADCPSGSHDYFCDGKKDGICDPDCNLKQDPDCQVNVKK